jgi:hypothetical protein
MEKAPGNAERHATVRAAWGKAELPWAVLTPSVGRGEYPLEPARDRAEEGRAIPDRRGGVRAWVIAPG